MAAPYRSPYYNWNPNRITVGLGGGGGGAVDSVFGRTGAVAAVNGDYTASNITNVPAGTIAAVTVQAAITELDGDVTAAAAAAAAAASGAASALAAHVAAADPHTVYQLKSEKGAINGYAGLGAAALVPAAQLGGGTPSATTALFGDQTYKTTPTHVASAANRIPFYTGANALGNSADITWNDTTKVLALATGGSLVAAGQVQSGAGSVGAPGLAVGEATTGLFRPSAGVLAAVIAGVEAIRIVSAYIDLQRPTYLRKVYGNNTSGPITINAGSGSFQVYTNTGAGAKIVANLAAGLAIGTVLQFMCTNANGWDVVAGSGESIRIAAAVTSGARTATNTAQGSTLTIEKVSATEWFAVGAPNGTWTLT